MELKELTQLQKILADETRLRIVFLLAHKELTVTDICAALEQNQSTVSKHLVKLRLFGVAHHVREGNFIYYSLNDNKDYLLIINFLVENFKYNETFKKDINNLNKILS